MKEGIVTDLFVYIKCTVYLNFYDNYGTWLKVGFVVGRHESGAHSTVSLGVG